MIVLAAVEQILHRRTESADGRGMFTVVPKMIYVDGLLSTVGRCFCDARISTYSVCGSGLVARGFF